MANTEKKSNQSAPTQDSTLASAKSVSVNAPTDNVPTTNKSNPNLVMVLVLCIVLIIGLVMAFMFKEDDRLNGGEPLSERKEKETLQRLIDTERGGATPDRRASVAALEGRISANIKNAHEVQSEFEMMKTGYTDAQEKLTRMENNEQGYMNTIARLGSENIALKSQMAQFQRLAENAQAYQNQAQQLANSNAEKAALIDTLQGRPSNESIEQLKKSLNNEQMTTADLMRKLQNLELKMLSITNSKEVTNQAELQTQNNDLRIQLQALQTSIDFAKLFVKSPIKLPLNAQALFTELKTLEGHSEEALSGAYTKIASELNAQNLQQVRFAKGSSILNFTDQKMIKNKLDMTNATDYFLVVGYGSQSEDTALNETLSVNRATGVASIVNQLKKEGQEVRAVYLGQTSRFSTSVIADNQLCEIWRIKK
jgi:hypothetical protein